MHIDNWLVGSVHNKQFNDSFPPSSGHENAYTTLRLTSFVSALVEVVRFASLGPPSTTKGRS